MAVDSGQRSAGSRAVSSSRSDVGERVAGWLRWKPLAWVLVVLPGLWPIGPLWLRPAIDALADPLKYLLHHLGLVACVLLAVGLTFSPLRVLFPRWGVAQALNRHRRLVGVAAFAYASLHLSAQVLLVYDPELGLTVLGRELSKPFQAAGLAAWIILLVLAATSFDAVVRGLGSRAWKRLHRLVYVAAALAAWHQAVARKVFPLQVVWIFGPVVVLQAARIVRSRSRPSVEQS